MDGGVTLIISFVFERKFALLNVCDTIGKNDRKSSHGAIETKLTGLVEELDFVDGAQWRYDRESHEINGPFRDLLIDDQKRIVKRFSEKNQVGDADSELEEDSRGVDDVRPKEAQSEFDNIRVLQIVRIQVVSNFKHEQLGPG